MNVTVIFNEIIGPFITQLMQASCLSVGTWCLEMLSSREELAREAGECDNLVSHFYILDVTNTYERNPLSASSGRHEINISSYSRHSFLMLDGTSSYRIAPRP